MDVFLCYPREQEESAKEIKGFVRSIGFDCWFDKDTLVAGEDWDRSRREALKQADAVIVVCSNETEGKDGVYQRELREALEHEKDRRLGSTYLFPVRVESCSLPSELKRFQYIDHFDTDWRRVLAKGLKLLAKQKEKTIPPALEVAAAEPDEVGVVTASLDEEWATAEFHLSWVTYELEGQYWDFVNGVIRAKIFGDFYAARRHMNDWVRPDHVDMGSTWEMNISEYYRKNELVSLVVGWFDYYSGAAHPNHGVTTINIFGTEAGVMSISELFDHEPKALQFLIDFANLDLRRQAEDTEEVIDLTSFIYEEPWELFEQFSFNDTGMQLNFSAASGLPHVFGHAEVYVPWQSVESLLSPTARKVLVGKTDDEIA